MVFRVVAEDHPAVKGWFQNFHIRSAMNLMEPLLRSTTYPELGFWVGGMIKSLMKQATLNVNESVKE